MNYVTTIEMTEKWVISARRIALLSEQGRIAENAEKPADKRKNEAIAL